MRVVAVSLVVAAVSLTGARLAREAIRTDSEDVTTPYAPSPAAAPFVALGYRELFADLMFVRFVGYFGGDEVQPAAVSDLVEAIEALDPQFRRVYEKGALAMTASQHVDQDSYLRAIALLERGMKHFPDDHKLPNIAGQIYLVDLQTKDPKQRAEWDEKGALLLEAAARKPGASAGGALTAAYVQSKLGQQERAISNLRELLLVTNDARARAQILERLAKLTEVNQEEIAAELLAARKRFDTKWRSERPALPPSMYVLLGPPIAPRFDMVDLALGGIGTTEEPFERLEPLE